jgi:hypothetical protein
MPDAGVSYVLNPDATSCYGEDGGKPRGLQTDVTLGGKKQDSFAYSAVGQPAFGKFAGGVSYVAPATGIFRALDLAVNEYQGGQDYLGAWDAATGQFRPGFPGVVNDLQFLTGPSVADVDGKPGEELLGGTAYLDVHAFDATGNDVGGWPKLTSDWMVTNPAIGTFGQRADDPDARKVVAAATRSGSLFVYGTGAGGCADGSWPRFHHDNANSGDYDRDAVAPARPGSVRLAGRRLTFTAPGDDGLCGQASAYEVVQSNRTVTGKSFARVRAATVKPGDAGATQSIALTGRKRRSVGIRAVDDQGNAGPVATIGKGKRAAPRPRLRVTVAPRKAHAGTPTTFRIRVRDARGRGVRGAVVRLAGRRVKTNRRGRATVRVSLGDRRRYTVSARRGRASGKASVRVVQTRA